MLCERGGRRKEEGKEEEHGRRTSEAVQQKNKNPTQQCGEQEPHTTMHDRNKLPESTVGVFESLGLGGRRTCIAMCFCIMQHRNHTLVCRAIECMHSIAEIFPTPNTVGLKR